ncbi:hypothetical protein IGA70_31445, partial [Pseudomonas aeruginosa]|nr:hypothetical protein [Pseudomonas aeruginosa]
LLIYNRELIGATPASTFLEAFGNGVRFDLRVVVYAVAPLVLSFGQHSMHSRTKLPFIAMATEKSAQIFPDRL